MNTTFREKLKNKKRIVIKIGSSSLTHPDTGYLETIAHGTKAGMCSHRAGKAHDDLSEIIRRI